MIKFRSWFKHGVMARDFTHQITEICLHLRSQAISKEIIVDRAK